MTTLALQDLSETLRGFYVPQFEVRIEGAGLPKDVLRDVVQVTYKDSLDELDSFQITVNNWDDTRKQFKYMGAETAEELAAGDEAAARFRLFEPCSRQVTLHMGYLGRMVLMMTGTITTMEPLFSESAAPTLNVRALNVLHQFRRKRYSDNYLDENESEIAEQIAQRPASRRDRSNRFPMAICANRSALEDDERIPLIAQKNEYDIDFLWKLARKKGYVVAVREQILSDGREIQPGHLYFGPSDGVSACNRESGDQETDIAPPIVYELVWGRSLIDFKPRLTTANQFKSVTVNGWDRAAQRAISETIDFTDKKLKDLNCDLHSLIVQCDPREELVVDEPVYTVREAKQRARALLMDQHKQMVTASARTVGVPQLRAGVNVRIGGVGSRLSGTYLITKSDHTINDSGYVTKLDMRREHIPDGKEPKCPTNSQA